MASSFDFHQWYSTIDLPTDYKDDVLYHFLKKELLVTRGALLGADFTLLRGELPIGAIGALVMAIEPLKKKSTRLTHQRSTPRNFSRQLLPLSARVNEVPARPNIPQNSTVSSTIETFSNDDAADGVLKGFALTEPTQRLILPPILNCTCIFVRIMCTPQNARAQIVRDIVKMGFYHGFIKRSSNAASVELTIVIPNAKEVAIVIGDGLFQYLSSRWKVVDSDCAIDKVNYEWVHLADYPFLVVTQPVVIGSDESFLSDSSDIKSVISVPSNSDHENVAVGPKQQKKSQKSSQKSQKGFTTYNPFS